MIELFLAISFIVLGGCVGHLLGRKYSKRACFFKSIYQFNNDFTNELGFCKRNINSILSKRYESDELNKILEQMKNCLNDGSLLDLNKITILKRSEIYDIEDFFYSLGKSDCNTQSRILNTYSSIFAKKLDEATFEQNKYGSLCKKTGIMIGLIAFVIAV